MNALLKHELMYYFKNRHEAIYLYSYFASIVMLLPFTTHYQDSKLQELAAVGLWIALASGIAIGAGTLFRRDHEQGLLEYYQLLPIPLEGIVATKWLAFLLFVTVPLLAIVPVAGLLFNLGGAELGRYAIGLSAGAVGLSVLSTLVAALTTGLEKAGAILSLIILPLSIPLMIFGADYCRSGGAWSQPSLWFLLGFSLFMAPIMCFAGAYSIRSAN